MCINLLIEIVSSLIPGERDAMHYSFPNQKAEMFIGSPLFILLESEKGLNCHLTSKQNGRGPKIRLLQTGKSFFIFSLDPPNQNNRAPAQSKIMGSQNCVVTLNFLLSSRDGLFWWLILLMYTFAEKCA